MLVTDQTFLRPSLESITSASLQAPADGPGAGAITFERNRSAWLSIADFLARQNLRAVLAARLEAGAAAGKRSAAAAPASCGLSALPDGNHGENLQ